MFIFDYQDEQSSEEKQLSSEDILFPPDKKNELLNEKKQAYKNIFLIKMLYL